jgi:hypothetical protein
MNLKPLLKTAQRWALDNSPSILTVVGTIGTISTAVLATRAGYSSALLLAEAKDRPSLQGEDFDTSLSNREVVELVWKEFIPPAVVGTMTLVAIIGANRIGTRRAAALAAAFKISEKAAEEYRQKVIETVGAKSEEDIRSEVARERIQRLDNLENLVITGSQEIFYDYWSARVFLSTREQVHQAVNQLNYQINQSYSASLSEFYDLLDLERTAVSDEFGWNSDELLQPWYTATLLKDGRAAIEIRYSIQPFRDFNKIGV